MNRICIRREDKSEWEARAPLVPADAKRLIEKHGLDLWIQPSTNRAFSDADYAAAGVRLTEDTFGCDVIVCEKMTYVFPAANFSTWISLTPMVTSMNLRQTE